MTTTELIELLKKYEFGGATGRPREVSIQVGDDIYKTDIKAIGTGDGLVTELYLVLSAKPKNTIELGTEYSTKDYTITITTNSTEREVDESPSKFLVKEQTFKVEKTI